MDNDLIDEHVSVKQCRLAIDALHAHESKKQAKIEEQELLPAKEPNIWLNVAVKKIPPGHRIKPVKVPVVHPIIDPRTTPICLITKDPQRHYKDLLETNNIKFISRVVGIEKLKGKFKPFEARRALLKENGMFLADDRVIPLLPKLLGKKWFEAKKQPIPVCLTRKDLKGELERAISSTYMNQNQGTCTSIKIGVLSHTPAQIVANLQKALPTIAANIKDGWENIQSLYIKTNSSVSLPIWTCSLDASEGGRWHGLQVEFEEFAGIEDEEEVEEKTTGKRKEGAGKKRPSSSEDEEDEEEKEEDKPRKRAKSADGSVVKPKDKTKALTKKDSISSTSKPALQKIEKVKAVIKPQSTSEKTAKTKARRSSPSIAPAGKLVSEKPSASKARTRFEVKKSADVSSASPVPSPTKTPLKSLQAPKPTAQVPKSEKKSKNVVSLERKKEKIVKQKGGKSAKNSVLGKKVAQE